MQTLTSHQAVVSQGPSATRSAVAERIAAIDSRISSIDLELLTINQRLGAINQSLSHQPSQSRALFSRLGGWLGGRSHRAQAQAAHPLSAPLSPRE